ncbi:MAG: hypothetical protein DYG89_25460 [Caldilinea sp. CFX5]|nr:hypothetical protein [Caldilinea sp. CFX5]
MHEHPKKISRYVRFFVALAYHILNRTVQRLTLRRLERLLIQLLKYLNVKETVLTGDLTGYTVSNASAYYRTRNGKRYRGWVKSSYTVGTQSQFIVVARSRWHYCANDASMLRPLRDGTRGYRRRGWMFLSDTGFDGQRVTARYLTYATNIYHPSLNDDSNRAMRRYNLCVK